MPLDLFTVIGWALWNKLLLSQGSEVFCVFSAFRREDDRRKPGTVCNQHSVRQDTGIAGAEWNHLPHSMAL